MPGDFGCYLESVEDETEREEKGRYRCNAFIVNKDIAKTEISEKRNKSCEGLNRGFFFLNFREVLQSMLEVHLSQYFDSAEIEFSKSVDNEAINIDPSFVFYEPSMRTGAKRAIVELQINFMTSDRSENVTSNVSHKIGSGHLAWLIPLGALTFPVGFLIGSMIFDNIEQKKMEEAVANAVKDAAAEAAKIIAEHEYP